MYCIYVVLRFASSLQGQPELVFPIASSAGLANALVVAELEALADLADVRQHSEVRKVIVVLRTGRAEMLSVETTECFATHKCTGWQAG